MLEPGCSGLGLDKSSSLCYTRYVVLFQRLRRQSVVFVRWGRCGLRRGSPVPRS